MVLMMIGLMMMLVSTFFNICHQSDQMLKIKKLPNFLKDSPKSRQVKKSQNIYNKAQFVNPKYLHQTTLKALKYLQQIMFSNCLFR
jgi:hypothetical protein